MEAATYLGSGFGIRTALEARRSGWTRMDALACISMPGRLKAILVSPRVGTPFLAATQAFDLRPTPRKWLALGRTTESASRFVKPGQILVTRSGSVGRALMAYAAHENTLISDDLLRVEPIVPAHRGWIYACLMSEQVRAMATGAQYGHVIKHLEVPHLEAIPLPAVDDTIASGFARKFDQILALRTNAWRLRALAEKLFADTLGPIEPADTENGFTVSASEFFGGRRRLEASYHVPTATAIVARMKRFDRLGDVATRVWWMSRFKRYYGAAGIPYLSADELFAVNPSEGKRILVKHDDNHKDYFVQEGWIVMACSGQVYGLNGAAALMTAYHEGVFFSHDLIRIIPDPAKVRAGYLLVALTHPTHGRPLLIRAAYGTSIPHLDPGDVSEFPVVRLSNSAETKIADLAEESARDWAEADALDREIAQDASRMIDRFLNGSVPYGLEVKRLKVAERH